MHDVFDSIKNLIKVDTVTTDNNVFKLHYKATMFLLVACSIMVSQKQYLGDPIDCVTSKDGMDHEIMDSYCWIHGTYVLRKYFHKPAENHPHPGVGAHSADEEMEEEEIVHHMYYQWVTLFLFLQAAMFYFPRYLWMTQEGEKMQKLVMDLDAPIVDEEKKSKKRAVLTDYFMTNRHKQEFYAYKYFGCEILNFVNVVGQMFFLNRFLGNEFTTYGTRVLNFDVEDEDRTDPMYMMFPRVTKCHMRSYGVSGSSQTHDALCVLPLNVINEKIFIFLWFWFIIVATVTGVFLVYRALCFVPPFRNFIISVRCKLVDAEHLKQVTSRCLIGDWFLLYQLSKNMDPLIYKEFVSDLANKLIDIPINPSAPPTTLYGALPTH